MQFSYYLLQFNFKFWNLDFSPKFFAFLGHCIWHTREAGLWTHGLDAWALDAWALDMSNLDSWMLGLWTLGLWMLGLWTLGCFDFWRLLWGLDAWILGTWTLNVWMLGRLDWTIGCFDSAELFSEIHGNCRRLKFYWIFPVIANFHRFIYTKNFILYW